MKTQDIEQTRMIPSLPSTAPSLTVQPMEGLITPRNLNPASIRAGPDSPQRVALKEECSELKAQATLLRSEARSYFRTQRQGFDRCAAEFEQQARDTAEAEVAQSRAAVEGSVESHGVRMAGGVRWVFIIISFSKVLPVASGIKLH